MGIRVNKGKSNNEEKIKIVGPVQFNIIIELPSQRHNSLSAQNKQWIYNDIIQVLTVHETHNCLFSRQ
ncbi:hypothetical protein BgiBS90_023522, partial [Biomphalaria glabrata]